eukprot:1861568-Prorocentrum_lima.AAC.1
MTSSLVGSEMCIRDSLPGETGFPFSSSSASATVPVLSPVSSNLASAVSYTHLTLPTICSV